MWIVDQFQLPRHHGALRLLRVCRELLSKSESGKFEAAVLPWASIGVEDGLTGSDRLEDT